MTKPQPKPVDLAEEWRGLQRRLVDLMRGEDQSDFGEGVLELDPAVYTDAARFECERKMIFRDQPILVALSGELAEPGDRVLFDAAGPPILIVRGEDGVLRAFLNMCTHRGSKLVSSCERTKRLMCPFHGWVFDLEGRIASMPMSRAFAGVEPESRRLVRVPVAELHGMVFVKARPAKATEETIDLDDFLGPIAPLLRALDLGSLVRVCADRLEAKANWKLALDMGRENYHVPVVHKDSLARNLYPHVTVFDCYGPHSRFAGASRDFADLVDKPESEWPKVNYQAVHYLFPNTTLSFTHAVDGATPVVTMSRVFAGNSVGETVTHMATYRRGEAEGVEDEQLVAMHEAVVGIVGTEDYGVAEAVWQNIERDAPGMPFVLGRNELLVQRYHQEIADRIGMPLP
jgi:phenylpropionate dioxygenase-like ring-hydroxylating dioxygenase large terminal subunit